MSGIGKIFVVLNLVFSLVIVGAAATYLSKADEWKTKHDDLKKTFDEKTEELNQTVSDLTTRFDEVSKDRDSKQDKIADLELETSRLNDELKSAEVDAQQLRNDVSQINNSLRNFQTNINEVNARNNELVDQNATFRTESLDAKEAQRQAEDNLIRVQGELAMANEQIQDLEVRVTQSDEEKEHLANILTVAQQKGFDISSIVAMPEIAAYIEDVNNELGYVILSVGSDDQVKKGYTFSVHRGSNYLGEVQVDQVYPDRCSALIKFQANGMQMKVNDKATTIL